MPLTLDELGRWLLAKEDEHLEFKEAKNRFGFDELLEYCAAIANEGGGHILLGVSDKRPRRVVGSRAFTDLEATRGGLTKALALKIESERILHPDGPVTVFTVPPRPAGVPIQVKGRYLMRAGDGLVPMTQDQLRKILDEVGRDFSAEVCPAASLKDLDPGAITRFRSLWRRRSENPSLERLDAARLLRDAELMVGDRPTHAALILLGTESALGRFVPQAEVIFEYRSSDATIAFQQRHEFRMGFLLFMDELWQQINLRNDITTFQDGLFMHQVRAWNEAVVREAVLNAVAHREYRDQGSVWIRQSPTRLEVVSPGGFPPGVTAENIVFRQAHRNRRIAETLNRCGLVDRSGQGADRMFETSIREGKGKPEFAGTDAFQVRLMLRGEILDPSFLRFLEQVGQQRLDTWGTGAFLVVDLVHREERVPEELRDSAEHLVKQGVIERVGGRGRGARFVLSRQFYAFLGRPGEHTRRVGLDRSTNKELLVRHVSNRGEQGARLVELRQVLPALTAAQVQSLLKELKAEQRVHCVGKTRAAVWFVGPGAAPT